MSLFFTGLKHSGKTTLASIAAKYYNKTIIDSDDLILNNIEYSSVREFYTTCGKEKFIEKEYELVNKYIYDNSDYFMSLGGGASDNKKLIELIKKTGCIVYIKRPEDLLIDHIIKTSGVPPFLDKNNIKGSFSSLYKKRDELYTQAADIIIEMDTYDSLDIAKNKIIKDLDKYKGQYNGW